MKTVNTLISICLSYLAFGQSYNYTVQLDACKHDKVKVELNYSLKGKDTAHFNFPMTIPGTYAVLDYGKYISKVKAFDSKGKALKVSKKGNNTFLIIPGNDIQKVTYLVEDSWDSKEKKNKIFEPAGTGFEAGEYFYINAGGMMGFFDNDLLTPINVTYKKPEKLNGYTSLEETNRSMVTQSFHAKNYHDLIDNPVLFTAEKEEKLAVGNTDVSVASYYKNSDSSSYYVRMKIDSAMIALDKFTGGNLPVSKYSFLNYVVDFTEIGELLMKDKIGMFTYLKMYLKMGNQGFGALEHGNSSSYYLPDFGHHSYTSMLYETAIHEFLHIYAPLSLHSTYIGNFNYIEPKMSKHLWLYEGVTEYFSVLVAMQGNLSSIDETVKNNIKSKIIDSYSYPDAIPFTTMSANVFEKPYIDQYNQVYTRGAVMAMLLDIEIMRLTKGEKTLKTVVFDLCQQYGSKQSFNEETFISEFVSKVHPDLQTFFDKYVTGTTPLAIHEGFATIGIDYSKERQGFVPIDILSMEDNKVKVNRGVVINNAVTIQSADKSNIVGFQSGDKVNLKEAEDCFKNQDGTYVSAGTMVNLNVKRKGETVLLTFPASFKNGSIKNEIGIMPTMSTEQESLFKLWSTGTK